eukprot:5568323-Amphidinium_carterae.1
MVLVVVFCFSGLGIGQHLQFLSARGSKQGKNLTHFEQSCNQFAFRETVQAQKQRNRKTLCVNSWQHQTEMAFLPTGKVSLDFAVPTVEVTRFFNFIFIFIIIISSINLQLPLLRFVGSSTENTVFTPLKWASAEAQCRSV